MGGQAQAFPPAGAGLDQPAFPESVRQERPCWAMEFQLRRRELPKGKPSRGEKGADGVPGRAQASRCVACRGSCGLGC